MSSDQVIATTISKGCYAKTIQIRGLPHWVEWDYITLHTLNVVHFI